MGKVKDQVLFTLIKNYLTVYLPDIRSASANTITTYRTVLNKLLSYTATKFNKSLLAVTLDDITKDTVQDYLSYISLEKGMSDATYNNRLAAIKAFFSYSSACSPEYIKLYSEIATIKSRKIDLFKSVDYMTETAVKNMLSLPNVKSRTGLRDQFFMILLYDTGARIQEIITARICDIKATNTPTIVLHGKGRKTRIVPIMKETVNHLHNYLSVFHPTENEYSEKFLFYSVNEEGKKPYALTLLESG